MMLNMIPTQRRNAKAVNWTEECKHDGRHRKTGGPDISVPSGRPCLRREAGSMRATFPVARTRATLNQSLAVEADRA